jgi:hypothetical protein
MRYLLTVVLIAMSLVAGTAPARAQEATPTAADFGNLDYTNVRYFLPFTPDGLAPGLNVTGEVSGTCVEQSLADIGRGDAWFCTDASTGDQYDPCFENSFGAIDEQSDLICAESPFSTDVVRFTLTDPIQREKDAVAEDVPPQADAAPNQAPPKQGKKDRQDQDMAPAEVAPPPPTDVAETAIEPLDIPWAVELANGERCELLTGATAVFAGQRLNYGCESGGYVIGELQRDGAVWLASFLAKDAYASDLVPVAVVWT